MGAPGDAIRLLVITQIHEPLQAYQGFHHRVAPLTVAHGVTVVLDFLQKSQALQLGNYFIPSLKALHAGVLSGGVGHVAVKSDDVYDFQLVPLADLEIYQIVARRYLQCSSAEVPADGVVADNGDASAHDGERGPAAQQMLVAGVFGIYGYSCVAQHGLRAGGGYSYMRPGVLFQRVSDVIKGAVLLLVVHFQVGEGGCAPRTPVDDALVAVNEALVVQVYKRSTYGLDRSGVQGELVAGLVGRDAQAPGLFVDDAAVFPDVLPDQLHELLPA